VFFINKTITYARNAGPSAIDAVHLSSLIGQMGYTDCLFGREANGKRTDH
jgi:hypothetical protein